MENQEVMNETVQYQTDNAEPMVDASQIFEPEAEAEGESQEVEEVRDTLLEVCETNIKVDWNCAEARDEFSDMHDLVDLLFTRILKGVSNE